MGLVVGIALELCVIGPTVAEAAPAGLIVHNDVPTGIESDADAFVSMRYMRHLWIAPDGAQVAVVQQGGTVGLGLYSSFDDGESWTWELDIPSRPTFVSDGVMLDDGSLVLVTSHPNTGTIDDVESIRIDYDPGAQQWFVDPLGPSTVYDSRDAARATRASLAIDSNGVLWSAFRLQAATTGNFRIRLFFSPDLGQTWHDSGVLLGAANRWAEKSGKVIATGSGIGVVVHDLAGPANAPVRSKRWAFREDTDPFDTAMPTELVAQMALSTGDPYGSHWSVAADASGNIHLSYQDDTITYVRWDGLSQTWSAPRSLASVVGSYNSLTVVGNGDVYVFARFNGGNNLWVRRRFASEQWGSGWIQVSSGPQQGLMRMCTPERVDDRLPLLYQVNDTAPYELLHCLLDV